MATPHAALFFWKTEQYILLLHLKHVQGILNFCKTFFFHYIKLSIIFSVSSYKSVYLDPIFYFIVRVVGIMCHLSILVTFFTISLFHGLKTAVERDEISPSMQESLRRHIVQERERRKQEEKEAEKDFERRAKIEEERKRKEEEDSVTLEQIKEQLSDLHNKLERLKKEKHQLFSQLKKVLTEEDRRKQKLKEQSELNAAAHGHFSSQIGSYPVILPGGSRYQPPHQIPVPFIPGHSSGLMGQSSSHLHPGLRHSLNQQITQQSSAHQQAVKRPLSPASPQPGSIKMYQGGSGVSSSHGHLSSGFAGAEHFSPHSRVSSASSIPQQAVHSTPTRHISSLHGGMSPSGRPNSQGSPYSMSLGKQLEHASQKSGFGDDSASPRRLPIRMLPGSMIQQQSALGQLTQSPRVRSGSPGKYQMNPEKSHSPFHTATTSIPTFHQSRFYNK